MAVGVRQVGTVQLGRYATVAILIAIFCRDQSKCARLASIAGRVAHVAAASDWDHFSASAQVALVSVLAVEGETSVDAVLLRKYGARGPGSRALVVVAGRQAGRQYLASLAADSTVWEHDISTELGPALQRAWASEFRRVICAIIRGASNLPPTLRVILTTALSLEQPARTVFDLSRASGYDRKTFWYNWRKVAVDHVGLRPQDFVDWVLLLHAVACKRRDRTWVASAANVKLHRETLARVARRLTRRTLNDLEATGFPAVAKEFAERIIIPLAPYGAATICGLFPHFVAFPPTLPSVSWFSDTAVLGHRGERPAAAACAGDLGLISTATGGSMQTLENYGVRPLDTDEMGEVNGGCGKTLCLIAGAAGHLARSVYEWFKKQDVCENDSCRNGVGH